MGISYLDNGIKPSSITSDQLYDDQYSQACLLIGVLRHRQCKDGAYNIIQAAIDHKNYRRSCLIWTIDILSVADTLWSDKNESMNNKLHRKVLNARISELQKEYPDLKKDVKEAVKYGASITLDRLLLRDIPDEKIYDFLTFEYIRCPQILKEMADNVTVATPCLQEKADVATVATLFIEIIALMTLNQPYTKKIRNFCNRLIEAVQDIQYDENSVPGMVLNEILEYSKRINLHKDIFEINLNRPNLLENPKFELSAAAMAVD